MNPYNLTPRYVTPTHVDGKTKYYVDDPNGIKPYEIWLKDSQVVKKQLEYQAVGKTLYGNDIKALVPVIQPKKEVIVRPLAPNGKQSVARKNERAVENSKYLTVPMVVNQTGLLYAGLLEAASAIGVAPVKLYEHLFCGGFQTRTYTVRLATDEEIAAGKGIGDLHDYRMPNRIPIWIDSVNKWFSTPKSAYLTARITRNRLAKLMLAGEARFATIEDIRTIDFDKLFKP